MKKIAVIVVSLITAGGIAIAGIAHAYGNPEKRAEKMIEKISDRMELSDYQKTQLVALKDTLMAMKDDVRETRSQTGQTIDELLSQPQLDQQRALQLIDQPMNTVKEKMPAVIAAFADFWNSLDSQQQAQLRERFYHRFEHHDRWEHRRSNFGGEVSSEPMVL